MKKRNFSKGLSKWLKGEKGTKSVKEFMRSEKDLMNSVNVVIDYLREKYSSIEFSYRSSLTLNNVADNLKEKYSKYEFRNIGKTSCIRPDGGFIYASQGENEFIFAISEMKYQKSMSGNAFERSAKNITVCRDLMAGEKYFPYILFVQGKVATAINLVDRIYSMNYNLLDNTVYVVEEDYPDFRPFTIIVKENITMDLEIQTITEVCEKSIQYLIGKNKLKDNIFN